MISLIFFVSSACSSTKEQTSFTIVSNPDRSQAAFAEFDRKIEVFFLVLYAEQGVRDAQLLHAATIMAELLDNDEDGAVDDATLLEQLQDSQACMPIFASEGSLAEMTMFDHYDGIGVGAVLYAQEVDENNPGKWSYDASVEEIMHTINSVGHVFVYPDAFQLSPNSSLLSDAMDVARGGQFEAVPSQYPESSWFHYDDETCDYECMAIEYMYWSQVAWMGLLNDDSICSGISNEWELCTPQSFQETDTAMHDVVTTQEYHLPQKAPNGEYGPMLQE